MDYMPLIYAIAAAAGLVFIATAVIDIVKNRNKGKWKH